MTAPDLPEGKDDLDAVLRKIAELQKQFFGDIAGADAVRCRELSARFDEAMAPLLKREAELRGGKA